MTDPSPKRRLVASGHLAAVLAALRRFDSQIEGCFCPALHMETSSALENLQAAAEFDGLDDDQLVDEFLGGTGVEHDGLT